MKVLLKEVQTLLEFKGDLVTPKELAILLNVDYDTYEIELG